MSRPLLLLLALAGLLLALELGIPAWRRAVPVADAPVFSLPLMSTAMQQPGDFAQAIKVYQADRGGKLKLAGPDGTGLTVFYFEWDQIDAGPMMDIAGHRPEECNVGAGFTLKSHDPKRVFAAPDHSSLVFDTTTFAEPSGRNVHVYKTAWLQGFGSREIREGENRFLRLKNSFERGGGAARVIECGITGARDEPHAWQVFQSQILQQLAWSKA